MMKDQFGRETKVGDIVVFSSMNTTGLYEAVVLKIGENQIKTSKGNKAAANFAVVTDQLLANGQEARVEKHRREHSHQMDFSIAKPKPPSTKWKYAIGRKGQFIIVGKLACNNQSDQYGSMNAFIKGKDEVLESYQSYRGNLGYVKSFQVSQRPNGYSDSALFKLSEIKELGLVNAIEKEITIEAFHAALDSSKSTDAVTLKASGVWKL